MLSNLIERYDPRVIQTRRGLSFAVKSLYRFTARQLTRQYHLQRNDAIELYLPRLVNHPHPATSDFVQQLIFTEVANVVTSPRIRPRIDTLRRRDRVLASDLKR